MNLLIRGRSNFAAKGRINWLAKKIRGPAAKGLQDHQSPKTIRNTVDVPQILNRGHVWVVVTVIGERVK